MAFPVTQKRRLERLPGAATADGIEYEWKLAGLLALRAYKKGLEFELFSNVEKARPLDDLVLRLLGSSPSIYFFQLKHSREKKENLSKKKKKNDSKPDVEDNVLTEESFTSAKAKGDFNLRKYFDWFSKLLDQSRTEEFSDLLLNTPLNNLHLALFTTKDAHPDIRKCQRLAPVVQKKDFPLEDLFHTSKKGAEDVFSFDSSCPKVWELFGEDDKKDLYQNEFLGSLKVFCNQAHSSEIEKKIEVELVDIFGKNAEKFLQPFEESLKQWSDNNVDNYCLSNKIILGFFTQQLRKTAQQTVCQNLKFKLESLKDLRAALRHATSLLRVSVNEAKEPGLRAAKILQAVSAEFGDEAWLYVDGSILNGFKEEALIAAVRSVKVIVHDFKKGKDVDLARKLFASLEPRSKVLEVTIQNAEKCVFEDIWQLQDLSYEMQQSMLERTVTFHGEEMLLEELEQTWPSMRKDVRADFITNKREWTIGKKIDESEVKMLDRRLSHLHEVSAKVISDKEAALNGGRLALLGFPQHILEEAARQLGILKSKEDAEMVVKDNARWTVLNFQGETSSKVCKESLEAIAKEKSAPAVHLVEFLSGTKVEDVRLMWKDSFGKQEIMEDFVLPLSKECDVKKPVCLHRSVTSLEDSKRSLLVGPAGCGKTTTISCFASQLQKKCPTQWVILVKILKHQHLLRKWKNQTEVTVDQVVELLAAASGAETGSARRYLESSIKKEGAMSVLIDGVDEVAPAFEKITILLLKKLLKQPLRRVWVTTRPEMEASLRLMLQSPPLTLYPLTTEDQKRFIRTHLTVVSESEKDERIEKIMNLMAKTKEDEDFLTTPLHLVMTCQIFNTNKDTDFESNFTLLKLYEKFIEQKRTQYEDKFLIVSENLPLDDFERKHQKCAVVFLFEDDSHAAQLPIQEYKQYVANDKSLLLGREKIGLVWLDGESISFIHQTFAEYFAARWIFSNTKTYGARKFVLGLNKGEIFEYRIKIFLQDMLAEEWPLHAAAWRRDMKLVQRLMEERSWGREHWHEQDSMLQWTWGQYVQLAYEYDFPLSLEEKAVAEPWRCVALKAAAENGCHRIVAELLREGDFPPETLSEAMRKAAKGKEEGHTSIVETLLKNEVKDIPDDYYKMTALHLAAKRGNEATVALLVSQSANVNVRNELEQTPLYLAVWRDYHKVLEILLREKSLDVDAKDRNGYTPLYIASREGCVSCAESLLCRGANVDGGAHTPLAAAASRNNIEVLRMLLKNGAQVNKADKNGRTALHHAAYFGQKKYVQLLLLGGADVSIRDCDGKTSLDYAIQLGMEEIANILKTHKKSTPTKEIGRNLEDSEADVENIQEVLETCRGGDEDLIKSIPSSSLSLALRKIIEREGDNHVEDARTIAKTDGIGEWILEDGKGEEEESFLHMAAKRGNPKIIELLWSHYEDFNPRDERKRTPLHYAIGEESSPHKHEVAQMLLNQKIVDVNAVDEYGCTPLYYASVVDCITCVKDILTRKAKVNEGSDSENPLVAAARNNSIQVLGLLIEKGADVKKKDRFGWSALHIAAFNKSKDAVRMLLEKGADVSPKDYRGRTALDIARGQNDLQSVEVLEKFVSSGALPEKKREEELLHAVRSGKKQEVEELLKQSTFPLAKLNEALEAAVQEKGDVHTEITRFLLQQRDIIDKNETEYILSQAVRGGNIATVELLLRHADSSGDRKRTPLHMALGEGSSHHHEAVQFLLHGQNSDVNALDGSGRSPLLCATVVGCLPCVKALLDGGTQVQLHSIIPLAAAVRNNRTDIVKLLLDRGADVNGKEGKLNNTALHEAAWKGQPEALQLLLERGADVNPVNKKGFTPLHFAYDQGHVAAMDILLQHKANVNYHTSGGDTALHLAAFKGHHQALALLLERGADVDALNAKGSTALLDAAAHGHIQEMELLLSHRANINAQNNDGNTALHLAAKEGHRALEKLLEKGANKSNTNKSGQTAFDIALSNENLSGIKVLRHFINS